MWWKQIKHHLFHRAYTMVLIKGDWYIQCNECDIRSTGLKVI